MLITAQSPRPSANRRSANLGIEGTAGGSVGIFPLGIGVTDEQFQPWCRLSASEAMPTPGDLCPRTRRFRGLKAEGGGDYRALHVNVESQIAAARLIIEVEAAVTEVHVQPRVGGLSRRADDLPIAMRADAKPADIAVGRHAAAGAEIGRGSSGPH